MQGVDSLPRMPFLLVRQLGRTATIIPFEDSLIVGRHEQANVILAYGDVSRQHARFEKHADGVMLRDLGSRSGTFVNGVRVSEAQLAQGDVVSIGPAKLTFMLDNPQSIELVTESKTLEHDTVAASDPRLQLVLEIVQAAFANVEPRDLLDRMLDAILRVMGAERAVAALCENGDNKDLRYVTRLRQIDQTPENEPTLGAEVVQALLAGRSEIIRNHTQRQTSALGVPLRQGKRRLGFLYVDGQTQFNRDDLDFLHALAYLTVAALDSSERYDRVAAIAQAAATGVAVTSDILGRDPTILRLKDQIRRYGASAVTSILIHGESGTGKELVARAIHAASDRAKYPFVALSCAAIPESMLEGELFGYEKDAFSGALRGRRGRFALAHHGTLLLDEIGDLSLAAQAKVLRATQSGEIYPLGADQPITVDVRIIATTHKDLRAEVAAGRFREDLYFRINVVEILVPPLRERSEDILLLAQSFLEIMALNMGKQLKGFTQAAGEALMRYPWPGNVRELRNEIERAVLHAESDLVELDDLSPNLNRMVQSMPLESLEQAQAGATGSVGTPSVASLAQRYAALDVTERALVEEALQTARGNLAESARLLGITRIMMKRRVERYGLYGREL